MEKIIVTSEDIGERLDAVLVRHLNNYSRSQIKKWIDLSLVKVESVAKKGSYKVKENDEIIVDFSPPKKLIIQPQDIPLDIIYEDADLIVVNKSPDMVVHPAAGNYDGTLVNALLHHCRDLSGIGGSLRPGIVHRLDKGTSGVIVVAKNDAAHLALAKQFNSRTVSKTYYALIFGVPRTKQGTFDKEIGRHPIDRKKMSTTTRKGRTAVTHWEVLESFDKDASFVKVKIVTGRTHQIRVHFSAHGFPIVGDPVYGGKNRRFKDKLFDAAVANAERPMLHAASLILTHPRTGSTMTFEAPFPKDFSEVLEGLRATQK